MVVFTSTAVIHCRKKKPAGAVSMFGGVDLFGRSEQSSQGAETAEAPPTQPKAAAKPEKSSLSGGDGGLFDEGDEGEEDIFSFQPATKKKCALNRVNQLHFRAQHHVFRGCVEPKGSG